MTIPLGGALPHRSSNLPAHGRDSLILLESVRLFGLAPGGVYPATTVTSRAVRSYRTFSPLPFYNVPGSAC